MKDLLAARGTTGAGSLLGSLGDSEMTLFGSLSSGNGNYLLQKDNTAYTNAFGVGYTFPEKGSMVGGESGFWLQVGAEAGQHIEVAQFNISSEALFNNLSLNVMSEETIGTSLDLIDIAGNRIAQVRSYYGAIQNRLEHTANNLGNVVENLTAAESRIRDTDMAKEMVAYSNHQILEQAGTAMLAQTNQSKQGILTLLG